MLLSVGHPERGLETCHYKAAGTDKTKTFLLMCMHLLLVLLLLLPAATAGAPEQCS
jgi:hypothetical protein